MQSQILCDVLTAL